jgi:hypothetical protein
MRRYTKARLAYVWIGLRIELQGAIEVLDRVVEFSRLAIGDAARAVGVGVRRDWLRSPDVREAMFVEDPADEFTGTSLIDPAALQAPRSVAIPSTAADGTNFLIRRGLHCCKAQLTCRSFASNWAVMWLLAMIRCHQKTERVFPVKRQKADRSYGRPLGRSDVQEACSQQHAQAGINGLARQKTFALCALARQLARTTNGFRLLAGLLLGRLFIMAAKFHLAKDAFALHFLLQRLERLIDIVVANQNLHAFFPAGAPDSTKKQTLWQSDILPTLSLGLPLAGAQLAQMAINTTDVLDDRPPGRRRTGGLCSGVQFLHVALVLRHGTDCRR